MNLGDLTPTPKVSHGAVAGAASVVAVWLCRVLFGIEAPPEVAAALATLLGFAAAWLTPDDSSPGRHAAR